MYRKYDQILVLVVFLFINIVNSSLVPTNRNTSDIDTSRVIIGGSANLVHPHPEVKPTAVTFEYKPGVPPLENSQPSVEKPEVIQPENVNEGRPTRPPRPNRPNKPLKPENSNNNPFGWIVEWFDNFKGSRAPDVLNGTNAAQIFLQQLNETQTDQLYEILNHTRYNTSAEFEQFVGPNKGFFDWLLEVTGFSRPNPDSQNTKPKVCPQCSCGQSIKQIRIVGGIETQVNAYPWMAYLKYNGRFYCGASVINNKYLLTAAHCVSGFNKDRLEITLLDHDRSTPFETTTLTAKVINVYKHSRYNMGANYNNDIALIKVDKELEFKGLLNPVCLPTGKRSFTGYNGIATGWGATEEHGVISNKLREVEVPILANANCVKTGYGTRITENMLCAGFDEGKKDSCQGDSGGPLHVRNATGHQIVGIVSWGEGCAEPNFPGVYTRVNRYLTWIKANTKDACYCS